jgi:hypothetical protein
VSFPIKKNTASQYTYVMLFDGADTVTTPTIAAGDFKLSIDDGAEANPTTLPAESPAGSGWVKVVFTQAETNGDVLKVRWHDAAGDEWDDGGMTIRTSTATLSAIETDTQDLQTQIGTAGAGLTGVPWNSSWDAEVQSEAQDALQAYDLDHLIETTAGSEEPTDGSYLDQIMHKSGDQTFDATTDSLEALRDTMSSSTVTTVAAVSGSDITVVPYTTWEFTIDGLSDLSGALANGVIFTVKTNYEDADSAAILQVQEGVGLIRINGGAATAAKASLTVGAGEDEITVHVNSSQTGTISPNSAAVWDIKQLITASEDADQMATGTFVISDPAVTRKATTS